MSERGCRYLALGIAALAASSLGHATDARGKRDSFIVVAVDQAENGSARKIAPQPGKPARITVSVQDPASGFALGGIGVATWIVPDDGTSCEDWYARIGRASQVPDGVIPLIGFDIVQVTNDNHVALVDPLLDLASANLRAVSPAFDQVRALEVASDGQSIAIATGDGLSLRIGDPAAPSLATARLPAAVHSLAAAPGGFWSGLADGTAAFVDANAKPAYPVAIGDGAVSILGTDDDILIGLAGDGNAKNLSRETPTIRFPGAVRGGAISTLANSLFALSAPGDELFSADLDAPTSQTRYELSFPAARMASSPSGRWLALADEAGERIAIFDTEAMRVRWTINMPDPVIEMTFSDNFLYFMHRRQGGVTRVTFDLQASAPGLAAIAAGVASEDPQEAGPLPHLVRIRAGGVLVASSREQRAYIVSESGAQAAMAMIPLRAGKTAGVAVRQRGMTPGLQRGTYIGNFTAPDAGYYRAIVRTDAPELLQCQSFAVGAPRERLAAKGAKEAPPAPMLEARREGAAIAFKLTGGIASRAMLMRSDGTWRQFLSPVPDGTAGRLPLPYPIPVAGRYRLFVEAIQPDGSMDTLSQEIDL